MQTINLLELIPRCHEAAKAKGFWDVRPNAGQLLMLVIGELGEAQEADRKGRNAGALDIDRLVAMSNGTYHAPQSSEDYPWFFKSTVKDTVGDELADAYIRLCDFAGGFNLDLALISIQKCDPNHWVIGTDNFGDALLTCVQAVMDMQKVRLRTGFANNCMEGPLADALTWIEVLARQHHVDLATHIDLKLRYNATRERLHGKAY
ncbi:nucleoside triphosphate pyrophosphohydrolase family protein [Hymenobacter fodinae]|uniref:Uncharacterized protein n=1 Tax=Hymenobacter fodinae TaxID=2510796 RepID=A0A4Z0P5E4_9BACT|nr:hypothetical protein [Hymenobacter fodinae]TGE05596.1 hypothetical protein EU556_20050 [Hymenobacter fodinae]